MNSFGAQEKSIPNDLPISKNQNVGINNSSRIRGNWSTELAESSQTAGLEIFSLTHVDMQLYIFLYIYMCTRQPKKKHAQKAELCGRCNKIYMSPYVNVRMTCIIK